MSIGTGSSYTQSQVWDVPQDVPLNVTALAVVDVFGGALVTVSLGIEVVPMIFQPLTFVSVAVIVGYVAFVIFACIFMVATVTALCALHGNQVSEYLTAERAIETQTTISDYADTVTAHMNKLLEPFCG